MMCICHGHTTQMTHLIRPPSVLVIVVLKHVHRKGTPRRLDSDLRWDHVDLSHARLSLCRCCVWGLTSLSGFRLPVIKNKLSEWFHGSCLQGYRLVSGLRFSLRRGTTLPLGSSRWLQIMNIWQFFYSPISLLARHRRGSLSSSLTFLNFPLTAHHLLPDENQPLQTTPSHATLALTDSCLKKKRKKKHSTKAI